MIAFVYTEAFWTIVGNIATAAALAFVAYETLQLRSERKITLRAWVGDIGSRVIPMRVFNNRGESVKWEEWERESPEKQLGFAPTWIESSIKLKNFGQAPAINVQGRYLVVFDKKPSREDIVPVSFGPPFVMMPQGEQLFVFKDYGAHFHTSTGNTAYLVLEIKYESAGSKKERRFGFIAEWTRGAYEYIDSWNESSFDQ